MVVFARLSQGQLECLSCWSAALLDKQTQLEVSGPSVAITSVGQHGMHLMSQCHSCKLNLLLVATTFYGEQVNAMCKM